MAVLAPPRPDTIERQETDRLSDWILPRKVVVHNCDCHDFDQVILALMKSLPMSSDDAESFANLVHSTGRAIVYDGDLEKCEMVCENIIAWAGKGLAGLPLKVTIES